MLISDNLTGKEDLLQISYLPLTSGDVRLKSTIKIYKKALKSEKARIRYKANSADLDQTASIGAV